jgi:GcrA cell cycle regulator
MEWSEEVIAQLRALWADGLSTAEIGRRLGVTKNAIVGKAHRLDLAARPSPIRRDPDAEPTRRATVRRVDGPTLPPLPSAAPTAATVVRQPAPVARQPAPAPRPPVMAPPRPVIAPPPPRPVSTNLRPTGRVVTCCWPLGEPGTRDFRFCDAASEPGRPYCEEHVKIAYVRVRDRREDAA